MPAPICQQLLGQRPLTIWLTGLSGAGKSTLARSLEHALLLQARACHVLDGDEIRHGLNRDLGYSMADRSENIRRTAEVARLMNQAGLIVITALISPGAADRETARRIVTPERFVEVHVCTPLQVCETRDPKGLYRKARAGQLTEFTGVSSPYEVPLQPDLRIDTSSAPVAAAVAEVLQLIAPRIRLQAT